MGVVRAGSRGGEVLGPARHAPSTTGSGSRHGPGHVGGPTAGRHGEPAVDRARPAAHRPHGHRPERTLPRPGVERREVATVEVGPRQPRCAHDHQARGCRVAAAAPVATAPAAIALAPPRSPRAPRQHAEHAGDGERRQHRPSPHPCTSSCRAMTTRAAVHASGATAAGRPSKSTFSGNDPASVRWSPSQLSSASARSRCPLAAQAAANSAVSGVQLMPSSFQPDPRGHAPARPGHLGLRPGHRREHGVVGARPGRSVRRGRSPRRRPRSRRAGAGTPRRRTGRARRPTATRPRPGSARPARLAHERQHLGGAAQPGEHRRRRAQGHRALDELPVVGRGLRQVRAGVDDGHQPAWRCARASASAGSSSSTARSGAATASWCAPHTTHAEPVELGHPLVGRATGVRVVARLEHPVLALDLLQEGELLRRVLGVPDRGPGRWPRTTRHAATRSATGRSSPPR